MAEYNVKDCIAQKIGVPNKHIKTLVQCTRGLFACPDQQTLSDNKLYCKQIPKSEHIIMDEKPKTDVI